MERTKCLAVKEKQTRKFPKLFPNMIYKKFDP